MSSAYNLIKVQTAEEWKVFHEMRKKVLWQDRGRDGYDDNHPDDHNPKNFPLLVSFEGEMIGVFRIDTEGAGAIMRLVAIRTDLHRKGHGRILVQLAEEFAIGKSCKHMLINSAEDAVSFYEKCGYLQADSLQMIKTLCCDSE